jgi:hypothetical protein
MVTLGVSNVEEGFKELCRKRRDDSVTIAAQSSHAGGYPMSQRECAGFNWPPLAVAAGEPLGVGPEVSVATAARSGPFDRIASRIPPSVERTPLSANALVGVGQLACHTCRPSSAFSGTFSQ